MSEFMDEAKKLAGEHSDLADKGFDQAEQFAEQKTGGQFDSQIQAGEQQAEGFLGNGQPGQPGPESVNVARKAEGAGFRRPRALPSVRP